jgi:hypothetical protein
MKTTHSPKTSHQAALSTSDSWWNRQKLGTKATLLAIALGTLPVFATGTLAFLATSPAIKKQAIDLQESNVSKASQFVNRYMFERYGDIQIISNLPIFANRKVSSITTQAEKKAILEKYIRIYGVYDSIALLDLNGDSLVHSDGKNFQITRVASISKKF